MREALAAMGEALDECQAQAVFGLSLDELMSCVDKINVVVQRVAAIQLALIRQVDTLGVAAEMGATGTVAWLRDRHRMSGGAAARLVKLARALDSDLSPAAEALAAGAVNVEQVQVITDAVAKLPVEHRTAGEEHLLGEAACLGRGVLDLGRQTRLATGPLRRALVLRDRGCAFPGCDRPPRWTDAHHIQHWSNGGPTELPNLVLLCGYHHRLTHHSDWHVKINPKDGLPEFTPPAYVDADQRPRRNKYHRRE